LTAVLIKNGCLLVWLKKPQGGATRLETVSQKSTAQANIKNQRK